MLPLLPIHTITGVAVSGGVDSMLLYHFLSRTRTVTPYFYHHNTETSEKAYHWLQARLPNLVVGRLNDPIPKGRSPEDFWRWVRYAWISEQPGVIATAHHLGDVAETWIMTSLRGEPRTIRFAVRNVVRPLLLCTKEKLVTAARRWGVEWIEDETNQDLRYARNRVRHRMVTEALQVYPGFYSMLRKKVQEAVKAGG